MGSGFLKRLGWYFVGLSIGAVFFMFIYKKKSGETGIEFCYLPNCRVLKDIRSKPFVNNDTSTDTLYFKDMDAKMQSLLTDGDIDFSKSNTKSKPCKTYRITHSNDSIAIEVENCPDKAMIKEVIVFKD